MPMQILVRDHTSCVTRQRGSHSYHHEITPCRLGSGRCGRAVVHVSVLSKSKSLRPAQLGSVLAKAAHLSLACMSVLLRIHLNVILGKASTSVLSKETTVPPIQNIHFGVGELGVLFSII